MNRQLSSSLLTVNLDRKFIGLTKTNTPCPTPKGTEVDKMDNENLIEELNDSMEHVRGIGKMIDRDTLFYILKKHKIMR